jgi:hypothetical protein
MEFIFKGSKFTVDDVADTIDGWVIKKSEAVRYSADVEIVKNFNNDFPNLTLIGDSVEEKYEFLTNVVSRNSKLLEWYTSQKLLYSDLAQLPLYAEKLISPEKFKNIQTDLTKISRVISASVSKKIAASVEYKEKVKELDRIEKIEINKIKGGDPVIKILSLDSSKLPLSLSMAIEGFKPTGDDSEKAENRKLYVREVLTQFKISLLKLVVEKPDIDIDELLDELSLK